MRNQVFLLLLTLVFGFTVFQYGGVTPREWSLTLAALCLLSFAVWLSGSALPSAPGLSPVSSILAAAVIGYVGFQLLPLPAGWLLFLSPNRAGIARALDPIHPIRFAALSVSPQITFAHLLRLLAYLQIFFLIRHFAFQLIQRPWLLVLPLLAVASVESSIGLVQHFETGGYATGTYANHGHLGGLLEMTLPLSLVLIPIAFRRARRKGTESASKAVLVCALLACSALILAGLLYTASRMSLVVAGLAITILGVLVPGSRRNRFVIASLSAATGLSLLVLAAPFTLVTRFEGGLTSEVRLQIWKDSVKLIAHYPVFGCGLGTFASAVQKYRAATPLALVDFAHNDYLQLFAELGVIGFLPVIALGALTIRNTFAVARGETNESRRLIAIACGVSLVGIAVHSLVDFQFYIPANVMAAAWIAGLASGIGAHRAGGVSGGGRTAG